MNRSAIRELAFKFIYSMELQKEFDLEEQIEIYVEANEIEDKNAKEYINEVSTGIDKNAAQIVEMIEKNLKKDWKIDRVDKVSIGILKLAIYELEFTEVPYKVVINEAVELAKKYGEDETPKFVNGILASVIKELNKLGE